MTETKRPGPALPLNCQLHSLTTLPDMRGDLTEMFREEWFDSPPPQHWHVMRGRANGLSGIRVHARDWLYLCLLEGRMFVGLRDLRPGPKNEAGATQLALSDSTRQALVIAPGIAHGLYFPQPAMYLVGRVEGADPTGHLLCAWNSPDLGISWPCIAPDLAPSDQGGCTFAEFKTAFTAHWKKHNDA